jgi:hypothetical protein
MERKGIIISYAYECTSHASNIKNLTLGLNKGRCTSWTMKSDHGRWSYSMVPLHGPTCMIYFFFKNIKLLGPSLGVNQMWIERNDHAPKSECVDFQILNAQKGCFKKTKSNLITILFYIVFWSSPPVGPCQWIM